jgi:phosphate transport system substrate-binding protein
MIARHPRTLTRLVLALLVVAVLAPWSAGSAGAAAPDSYVPITGTGSTWSQNALDQWRRNVAANYGMTVNYTGNGSTSGRLDFIGGLDDFAISEIPFQARPEDGSAPEVPKVPYAYMPIVAGGTSFMYHLTINGKLVTNLRLSGEAITKIFTGVITKWNDPAIGADNPGLAMPDKAIVPVVRSDGSGTSAQFTRWMSKQFPALWQAFCNSVGHGSTCGMTSQYPVFGSAKAQKGSDGTSGYVAQNYGEGSITYVEYSYALKSGFPVAKVLNAAGYYVEPTAKAVAVALLKARINTDASSADYLTQILDDVYNDADQRAYPLSSYSYLIVPTQVAGIFTTAKGHTLGTFASYVLCEGQQQADALGYSPLPMNLVMAASDQIKRIPGASTSGIDFNSCNNPTFKAGDSPSTNQLALTAPNPPACDKQGPTQCTTGTGGAQAATPITKGASSAAGSGTAAGTTGGSGKSAGAGTGGTGGTVGTTNGAQGAPATGDVAYDANGVPVSGDAVRGTATATAFTLAASSSRNAQLLMAGSAGLLLAVITLPPLLSRRLRRGTSSGS